MAENEAKIKIKQSLFIMMFLGRFFVPLLEPRKQDSIIPADFILKILPDGLLVSYDESLLPKDIFPLPTARAQYQWLNNKNNLEPFVMPYTSIEKVSCDFYKTKGKVTNYVKLIEKELTVIPEEYKLKISLMYQNKAKSMKLEVNLHNQQEGQ